MPVVVVARDRELVADLTNSSRHGESYKEPMPIGEWTGLKTDLGIVVGPGSTSTDGLEVSFLCLATKGRRWTNRFSQATFSHLVEVVPLPVAQWIAAMPERYRPHLQHAVAVSGHPVPPSTWTEARSALLRLRPELDDLLAELERLLEPQLRLTEPQRRVYADEKDAVGVALSIAGFDRAPLAAWDVPADTHAPWLAGLRTGRVREDVLVTHDAARAEGWWPRAEPYVGIKEFTNNRNERLTVMNVNRHDIEHVAGVDLLYYRHEPASFTLVQYKRTTPQESANDPADPSLVFYPSSDASFREELTRMRAVEALAEATDGPVGVSGYRLHPHACWIKLCDPRGFAPQNDDLVPGMYVPLDFYDALITSPVTIGRKGGRIINRERLPRWVNNTLFVSLMSGGWVGSRGVQTEYLTQVVRHALEAKRSVVIAREQRTDIRNRRSR